MHRHWLLVEGIEKSLTPLLSGLSASRGQEWLLSFIGSSFQLLLKLPAVSASVSADVQLVNLQTLAGGSCGNSWGRYAVYFPLTPR